MMTSLSRMKIIGVGLLLLALAMGLSACSAENPSRDNAQVSSSGHQDSAKTDSEGSGGQDEVSGQDQLDQDERVLMYLEQTVPEVREFRQNIESYNQGSNTNYHFIMRIDSGPDPQSADTLTRDFYYIYVGSDMGSHTSRWNSFYVKKDLSELLVENLAGGSPLTVEDWRQMNGEPPAQ